jgi:hypothetical protein
MASRKHYQIGTQVVIVGKRLPEYTGKVGTVLRLLPNAEGIDLLDLYIIRVNGQEVSFRPHELRIAAST